MTDPAPLQCEVTPLIYPLAVWFFLTILAIPAVVVYLRCFRGRRVTSRSSRGPDMRSSASILTTKQSKKFDQEKKKFAVTAMDESWGIDPSELKFVKVIGRGNMGEVYLGMWRGTRVAIKGMLGSWAKNVDMIKRFKEEIDIMNKLHHPNILMFIGAVLDNFDLGEEGKAAEVPSSPGKKKDVWKKKGGKGGAEEGAAYLVTEFCENGNMADFLQSDRTMTWKMRLSMMTDTARGMLYLHGKAGIIQRDLKSENLLIDEYTNIKIADFGLSRALAPEGDMGTFCGTPTHVAPEIVRQEDYSEKADVFSFGIIMWELTTREQPYPGYEGLQVAYKVANENLRPPVPSYCPEEIAQLMVLCWDDDQHKRPTYKEVMNTLLEVRSVGWLVGSSTGST